jgi:hypothetical protein
MTCSSMNCSYLPGFKSVFSVADRVCIYSNGFNFGFDKSRPLGMICPAFLDNLSSHSKPGWSVFVLEFTINDTEYTTVRRALEELHPEMLLFTRRLKQIEICVVPNTSSTAPAETRVFDVRADTGNGFSEYAINSQFREKVDSSRYFRQEWDISNMPDHPKRQGTRETKMVLAFPFNDQGPIIAEQAMFAFLPLYRSPLPVNHYSAKRSLVSSLFKATSSRKLVAKGFLNKILGIPHYVMRLFTVLALQSRG